MRKPDLGLYQTISMSNDMNNRTELIFPSERHIRAWIIAVLVPLGSGLSWLPCRKAAIYIGMFSMCVRRTQLLHSASVVPFFLVGASDNTWLLNSPTQHQPYFCLRLEQATKSSTRVRLASEVFFSMFQLISSWNGLDSCGSCKFNARGSVSFISVTIDVSWRTP